MSYYNGKVVVITGAASGLGLEMARQLAPLVRALILLDLRPMSDADVAGHFGAFHAVVWSRGADVCDGEALQKLAQEQPFGAVDVVIANAGKGGVNPANAFSASMDKLIMSVNYFGTVNTFNAFMPAMLERRSGHLVGICSLASMRGLPNAASYCASKAAQLNLLESWRQDLRPFNIRVSSILPGFIKTAMTQHHEFKMPFMMDVGECARSILKAIACQRRFYMLPWPMALGSIINRLMPVWLYDFIIPLMIGGPVKRHPKMF